MLSLHDVPRPLDIARSRYTVWDCVHGSDGGTRCGDVVATAVLPKARLALVVVDLIGRGTHRARRAGAVGAHLLALLSLGVSPAAAVRFADADLQRGGWEDDVPPLATVFAGIADASNGTLTYASAAHDTALLLGRDGTHRHLAFTGPVAGLFEAPVFAQAEARFSTGDTLVVVTDGISDSQSRRRSVVRVGRDGSFRDPRAALRHRSGGSARRRRAATRIGRGRRRGAHRPLRPVLVRQSAPYIAFSKGIGMKGFTTVLLTAALGLTPLGAMAQTSSPLSPGTELTGTLNEAISSSSAHAGDPITISHVTSTDGSGTVTDATIYGHVESVTTAGMGRNARIRLSFDQAQLYNGKRFTLAARPTHIDVVTKSNAAREGVGAIVGDLLGNWVGKTIGATLLGPLGLIGGYLVAKNARQNVTIPQNSLVTLQVTTSRRQA
jgi:stage II sporulation SpoE-like protein